jgi:hypothetical protein
MRIDWWRKRGAVEGVDALPCAEGVLLTAEGDLLISWLPPPLKSATDAVRE